MYHYVRNPKGTEFPNLYSRSKEQFSFQVNHLEAEYGFCALDNLDASKRSTSLMTFDDGIKDHFENVMPLLKRHGIKAAFLSHRYHYKSQFCWTFISCNSSWAASLMGTCSSL